MHINCTNHIGRLTANPVLNQTDNGKDVTSFNLAVYNGKDKGGNERPPQFFRFVAWDKTAKFICERMTKGQQVYVTGRLQNREYEKDGEECYITEIVVSEITPLAKPKAA